MDAIQMAQMLNKPRGMANIVKELVKRIAVLEKKVAELEPKKRTRRTKAEMEQDAG